MREVAEFVAVLSCSLFTGAAVYVNLVEHPARMQCGVEVATTEFPPSYRRATVMQAVLAAVGLLSSRPNCEQRLTLGILTRDLTPVAGSSPLPSRGATAVLFHSQTTVDEDLIKRES